MIKLDHEWGCIDSGEPRKSAHQNRRLTPREIEQMIKNTRVTTRTHDTNKLAIALMLIVGSALFLLWFLGVIEL